MAEGLTMARDCNDKSAERPYAIERDEKEGRYKMLIDAGSRVFQCTTM